MDLNDRKDTTFCVVLCEWEECKMAGNNLHPTISMCVQPVPYNPRISINSFSFLSLSLSSHSFFLSHSFFFIFLFLCVFSVFFLSLLYSKFNTSATHKLWQRHFSVTSKQPRMGWYQEFLEDCKKKKDAWSDPALSLCLTKVNQVKYTISVCLSLTWLFYYKIIQERGSKNAVLVCVYAAT